MIKYFRYFFLIRWKIIFLLFSEFKMVLDTFHTTSFPYACLNEWKIFNLALIYQKIYGFLGIFNLCFHVKINNVKKQERAMSYHVQPLYVVMNINVPYILESGTLAESEDDELLIGISIVLMIQTLLLLFFLNYDLLKE